jgi:hypothetical protein
VARDEIDAYLRGEDPSRVAPQLPHSARAA